MKLNRISKITIICFLFTNILSDKSFGNYDYSDDLLKTVAVDYFPLTSTLLGHPLNLNVRDENGTTPLMIAAHLGHKEIFNQLFKSGANSKLLNKNNHNALIEAVLGDNGEILKSLLPKEQNLQVKEALLIARKLNKWVSFQILRKYFGHNKTQEILNNYASKPSSLVKIGDETTLLFEVEKMPNLCAEAKTQVLFQGTICQIENGIAKVKWQEINNPRNSNPLCGTQKFISLFEKSYTVEDKKKFFGDCGVAPIAIANFPTSFKIEDLMAKELL